MEVLKFCEGHKDGLHRNAVIVRQGKGFTVGKNTNSIRIVDGVMVVDNWSWGNHDLTFNQARRISDAWCNFE